MGPSRTQLASRLRLGIISASVLRKTWPGESFLARSPTDPHLH